MSCYFDSLSHYFHVNSNIIRKEICDYLEENRPIFDDIETKVVLDTIDKNYVARMRHQSTWGGGIEISATCNIWNINVVVHSNQMKPVVFEPIHKRPLYTIHLHWNGSHYEPYR
jgi:hypothetical protein